MLIIILKKSSQCISVMYLTPRTYHFHYSLLLAFFLSFNELISFFYFIFYNSFFVECHHWWSAWGWKRKIKNWALMKKLTTHLKKKIPSQWFYFIDGFRSIPLHLQMWKDPIMCWRSQLIEFTYIGMNAYVSPINIFNDFNVIIRTKKQCKENEVSYYRSSFNVI